MANDTYISPGVFGSEVDLTKKGSVSPVGSPAAVIGTSEKGPAFVPTTFASFAQFVEKFGTPDDDYPAMYAVKEWMRNSSAGTFERVLGAGYGIKDSSTGAVTNAGFSISGSYPDGWAKFLVAQVNDLNHMEYLEDAGFKADNPTTGSLILGVLFFDENTTMYCSSSYRQNDPIEYWDSYATFMESSASHSPNSPYMRLVLSSSAHTYNANSSVSNVNVFDVTTDPFSPDYFANVLNMDATQFSDKGYVLYAHFPVSPYVVTSSANTDSYALVSGSSETNSNSEEWLDAFGLYDTRYETPFSPTVISQRFGTKEYDLFHFEALSDGVWANNKIKISISNMRKSTVDTTDFGTFSVLVRKFDDTDQDPEILEQFFGLTLDPDSKNYIARKIGDKHTFYDHDQSDPSERRIVSTGDYSNVSKYIRVSISDDLKNGNVPDVALPWGFKGYKVPKTRYGRLAYSGSVHGITDFKDAVVPPLPFRTNIAKGDGSSRRSNKKLYWGIKFEHVSGTNGPYDDLGNGYVNEGKRHNKFLDNIAKFLGIEEQEVVVTGSEADSFHNHKFSLEKVNTSTHTSSISDSKYWVYSASSYATNAFTPSDRLNTFSTVAKFSFFLHRGFDGIDIKEKYALKDTDAMEKENSQGVQGNTIASFIEALDIMSNKELADIQLLTVPSMRNQLITNEVIDVCEDRFDCMGIVDVENVDSDLTVITGSMSSTPSVAETISKLESRNLDSNMAAAYFPDVKYWDDGQQKIIEMPPSVAVLGAYAFNDQVAYPWFVPAGFERGGLQSVRDVSVRLTSSDKDDLYDARINPIAKFPNSGPVIWGQKTLAATQSALDRVNIRRLLLDIRRSVRNVAKMFVFEPNRQTTWNRFVRIVKPILDRVKELSGIERYKIKMNEDTTSEEDIQNNIMRGTIMILPIKSAEFIALDFVLTNNDAIFE